MKKFTLLAMTCGVVALSSSAFAQLVSTGPFVGTYSEDFESFPNYNDIGFNGNASLSVMGGQAMFSDGSGGVNQSWIYSPANGANWSLAGNGSATVHGGVNGLGLYNNGSAIDALLTFASSVSDFGGYFADVDFSNVTLTFFDASMNQLGTSQMVEHGSNSMDWFGWSSTAGIKYVTFTGGDAPVMDDLQANPQGRVLTPEPVTMSLGAAGIGLFIRRRRNAKTA